MDLEALRTMLRDVIREELAVLTKPKSRAAAERQKRYRERKKIADAAVTDAKTRVSSPVSVTRDVTIHNSDATKHAQGASTSEVWNAYLQAYRHRYGVDPVRNATVNAQLKAFVKRVGLAEAPAIVTWYVASNTARRVQCKHSAGLLLMDAEGIRTEWAMGRDVTRHEAMQADRTQANGNVWGALIEEARHAGLAG